MANSEDPHFKFRRKSFEQLQEVSLAIEVLIDHTSFNESDVRDRVTELLTYLTQQTVPLEKNAFASDYWSKTADRLVALTLAQAIIKSDLESRSISVGDLDEAITGLTPFK